MYEPICHKSLYYCVPTFARIPLGYSQIFLVACSRVLSQLNPNFAKAEIKVMSNIELEIVQIPVAIAPLIFAVPLSWTEWKTKRQILSFVSKTLVPLILPWTEKPLRQGSLWDKKFPGKLLEKKSCRRKPLIWFFFISKFKRRCSTITPTTAWNKIS